MTRGVNCLEGAFADQERAHLDRVQAELEAVVDGDSEGDSEKGASDGAVHESLRERTDTVERVAAGLVGPGGLVSLRTHTQYVSFFVNEADLAWADLFRELKGDVEAQFETGLDLLDQRCEDADWDAGEEAALATIEAASEEYESALTELGMDPKPVC